MKTTFVLNKTRFERGFTLVEMMMASAVAIIMFGGMLITLVAQQRGFIAALYQMDSQADESRVMAYMSRDIRNATAINISAQGTQITLTVPTTTGTTSSPGTLNVNLGLPLLSLLSPTSSSPSTETITYYRQGTAIIRQVGNVQTQLSNSATQFGVSQAGTMVSANVTFQPSFSIVSNSNAMNGTQVTSSVYMLNASQP